MARWAVGFDIQAGSFDVHREGCADLSPRRRRLSRWAQKYHEGNHSRIEMVEAASPEEALRAALSDQFSGPTEHPADGGFPGGSFGAAGFSGRVLPCAKRNGA